ncbi:sensor histidine kinase [Pseudobacteriovorax antillogorgiicola]|uniref:histidine kinase n=1 Tax=Pseudobacteriovorax antillogorgiicola TaxID=1513793 RepID=A0A1Y6BIH3_9BACT|nr:sensor histidine kinase [Pseudobacteriovorax antillogorgiicola]TCS56441.1 signal transduction histidine kinase [Pseudobacteriovorax antillogorgiicola]SMF05428.1 Signal transduction histidine kinase [Pseudobacteriovorax antillogorgiicola]
MDPDRAWDVQDVLKRTFEPPHAGPYKLRQSNSAIWLRFQLTNPIEVSQTLILNSSAVFNVEFQLFKVVGDKAEPSGKEFKFHRPAIRMTIPPGTSNYVVKLVNWNNFYELNLHTIELLWKEGVLSLVTLGLAIGILLVTVYLSSGMWIGLRQTTLSYYLIYIHTLMVTIFANSGLIRYFFEGPALTWGTYNLSGFMGAVSIMCLAKLLSHLLRLKLNLKFLYYLCEAYTAVFFVLGIISLFTANPGLNEGIRLVIASFMIIGLLLFVLPFSHRVNGHRLLTIGWLSIIVGTAGYVLTIQNIIPRYWFSTNLILIGSCIHVICFTLVFLKQHKILKKEHQQIKEDLLIQSMESEKKEALVNLEKERTAALTSLVHVFSHDLRNPLTTVMGYLDLLVHEENSVPPKKLLQKIHQSAQRMDQIIDMVNKQEAIRLNKKELKLEDIDLMECIQATMDIFEGKLRAKGLRWTVHDEEQFKDTKVRADTTALTYCVFSNIISNAIKYSSYDDSIDWSIKVNQDQIEIAIADCGVGIPPEKLEAIRSFDQHIRSNKGTLGEDGTGFGLQQVHRFVGLMEGTMAIGPNPNGEDPNLSGTEVKITLKLSPQQSKEKVA